MRTSPLWSGTQNSSTWAEAALAAAAAAAGEMVADPVERALEPVGLDRLHQIVDRGDVERGDREIVEGGDEDDAGSTAEAESARATSIPSMPGMAMSSRTTSGATASAIRSAASPSLAVPTTVTPSTPREQQLQPLDRERLVVDDHHLERRRHQPLRHHRHVEMDGIAAVGIGAVRGSRRGRRSGRSAGRRRC